MRHLTEEQVILFHYGEAADRARIEEHLSGCAACRGEQEELRGALALLEETPAPERGAEYGAEVWRRLRERLRKRLSERRGGRWAIHPRPGGWALAGTMAALLLVAFLAGRRWPAPPPEEAPIPGPARERILLVAVGEHLDRAQMMLVDLVNTNGTTAAGGPTPGGGAEVDISGARRRAEELVAANRLYRQATAGAGEAPMAAVLEELERILIDIAHRPSSVSREELEETRRRIEARGILFKVRVIGSEVRERERTASPDAAAPRAPARGST